MARVEVARGGTTSRRGVEPYMARVGVVRGGTTSRGLRELYMARVGVVRGGDDGTTGLVVTMGLVVWVVVAIPVALLGSTNGKRRAWTLLLLPIPTAVVAIVAVVVSWVVAVVPDARDG